MHNLKNLSRNQLALLITVFSLSIVVLLLFNLHLGAGQEDEYVIELSLADEDLQDLLEQEEQKQKELNNSDPIKSHMALNETAKASIEEPEPIKTLEEIMAEKALAEAEGTKDFLGSEDGYEANLKELNKQRELNKQKLDELKAKKKPFTRTLENKRTSVSYSLVDRVSYELPPPIYTCIEGGTVVINIKVDADGYVEEASFNGKSSNTSNGCLVDNAITYALRARFDSSNKALQIGTITYVFQSK